MGSLTVRRNLVLNAAEGGLYIGSTAFLSAQTVLAALIVRLGGSNVEVGMLGVIQYVGLFFPQIFVARYVEASPWKKPGTIWYGLAQRLVWLLVAATVFFLGVVKPGLALWLFLLLFLLNQILMGVTTPFWFDLFAKVTPVDRRGRLVGIRNSLGGGAAFIGGILLTWLLATFTFPTNYTIAILFAAVLQMFSLAVQAQVAETDPSPVIPRQPVIEYLRQMPVLIRQNREFRWFVIAAMCLVIATMPIGFYTVYALNALGADELTVGQFTLMMVATQVVSALVNGYVADRFGNKAALLIAAAGLMLASGTALLAPSLGWFNLVYLFLGVNFGTEMMARYNMSIEFGPTAERSKYVSLMNTVLAPFYLTGVVGGLLSDAFGYEAVFACGILFSAAGIVLLGLYVKDPRSIVRPA